MSLKQFLEANMEQLLEDWEYAAVEIAPQLKGKDSAALRDHARQMLEFICQDLAIAQTKKETTNKALGKQKTLTSSAHAMDRVAQGLSMFQMVQEFRALRSRITCDWSNHQQGFTENDIDQLVRFNEAVDQLVANSVASYSALKEQETRMIETMLKASPDPAAIFDPDGKYLYLNMAMTDLANATSRDIIGKTPLELNLDVATGFQDAITTTVITGQTQRREYHHFSPSGRDLYIDCQFVPVFDDKNEVDAVVNTSRDITERKKSEYQAWRSANFDALTGIPNRRLFLDRLEQTLLEAERIGHSFALLFIDLDYFKQTNDQLGHEAGDHLLEQVAERLSTKVRAMDTVARLGGDEFTVILKETGRAGAKEVARELLTSLEQAFDVDSDKVNISGSVGVAVFPDDGKNVDQLMHSADRAMYVAKENGGQQVQIYASWMAQSESEHMRLSRQLEVAIRKDQLEVYYQPIIDLGTGAIYGAEALLRWNHPEKRLLTPSVFLNLAEKSGLINSIAAYVLDEAVSNQSRWRSLNNGNFPISINESPAFFLTRSLVDQWRARLPPNGHAASGITMELTSASLNNLRTHGFHSGESLGLPGASPKLVIDDVGIEPFSLLAVQEFKMDRIKIDKELVRKAGQGGEADNILEAIIAMAHAINVKVVGVGVETNSQLQFLARAGCDYAQGFLFSKPLDQDRFEALLAQDPKLPRRRL